MITHLLAQSWCEPSVRCRKVLLTGLGTPDDRKRFAADGTVKSFVLWNLADLGYAAPRTSPSPMTNQVTTAPDNYRSSATHPDNDFTLTCGSQTDCDTARRCRLVW